MTGYGYERHEIRLNAIYPTGAVEWYCPTCGRRIFLSGRPKRQMTILEVGDNYAFHSGSSGPSGGISIDSVVVKQDSKEELRDDDPSLRPWVEWMERKDFDKNWEL